MLNQIFESSLTPPAEKTEVAWWYIWVGRRLVVTIDPQDPKQPTGLPFVLDLRELGLTALREHYLGSLDGRPCYTAEIEEEAELPENLGTASLRRLFGQLDDGLVRVAGRAISIIDWDRNHKYCGRCGDLTQMDNDRARVCPSCGLRAYPRISPAVIMLVKKDDQLLLAHSNRHPSGFYSVLAGFAEPGETLEEAVAREVYEEVGLDVANIRYFGSQPWPFPDSLMIGFICDYAGGEITLHDDEIGEAAWYRPGEFPGMVPPGSISIAGQLIEWFVAQHSSNR